MTLMRMPVFTWTALCTNVLIIASFPVLTAVLVLLSLDRYVGTNFFTNDFGGNPMMYVNLIWIWGHPEVYILILPIFGVFSEVTSTFSGKRLFGYTSMVYATVVITILSYLVWLHHFFTMGSGASVNSFFGITTMIISIPTGEAVQLAVHHVPRPHPLRTADDVDHRVHAHLHHRRHDRRSARRSPADFVLHNSLFLIAHFHNVIIGGVVFGVFAAINYWWPKAFGFKLNQFWGKVSSGAGSSASGGLHPALHAGPDGRDPPYPRVRRSQPAALLHRRLLGALLIAAGIGAMVIQYGVSIWKREDLPTTGDPWDGRTLEWATSSPPPFYNFAFTPIVHDLDAWEDMKRAGAGRPLEGFRRSTCPATPARAWFLPASAPARLRADLAHLVAGRSRSWPAGQRDHPYLQLQARLPHPGRGRCRRRGTAHGPVGTPCPDPGATA
jgi:cytochrome o ubiquinol oxidase subunit 1